MICLKIIVFVFITVLLSKIELCLDGIDKYSYVCTCIWYSRRYSQFLPSVCSAVRICLMKLAEQTSLDDSMQSSVTRLLLKK